MHNIIDLDSKKRYYESYNFEKDLIPLMIPDAALFVRNIFYCMRCAKTSRNIFMDIINQMPKKRVETKTVLYSIEYNIGTLKLDGYEYAQRNMREWCSYIDKTNDGLCNFLILCLI